MNIEDLRNPGSKGKYHYVERHPDEKRVKRYRMNGAPPARVRGPWRLTAEEAAQDYLMYLSGRESVRLDPLPDLAPRERGRSSVTSDRKDPFPAPMARVILERAGGCCEACGRYSWWGEDIPLELDHIDPDGPNAVTNGQALCRNCHGVKTRRQREAA